MIHLTPGLRYTRYDKVQYYLPSPNAVDFLVGFQLKNFEFTSEIDFVLKPIKE